MVQQDTSLTENHQRFPQNTARLFGSKRIPDTCGRTSEVLRQWHVNDNAVIACTTRGMWSSLRGETAGNETRMTLFFSGGLQCPG